MLLTTPFALVPAAALAVSLAGARATRGAAAPAPLPRLRKTPGLLPAALVVFAAALAMLAPAVRPTPAHAGVAMDLLAARDCVDGPGCVLRYPIRDGGSSAGISHGAIFSHLLAAVRAVGFAERPEMLLWLAFGATALGAALLAALAGAVRASAGAGLAAGLVFALGAAGSMEATTLSPVLLVPAPAALATTAACAWLLTRRRAWLVVAGLGAGLAFQAHSSSLGLLASLAVPVIASPRGTRLHAAFLLAAGVTAVALVVSPAQFMTLRPHPPNPEAADLIQGNRLPLLVVALLGGASLALRVAGVPGERAVVAFLLVQVLLALVATAPPHGTTRYAIPLLGGTAGLAGIAAARLVAALGALSSPLLRRLRRTVEAAVARRRRAAVVAGALALALALFLRGSGESGVWLEGEGAPSVRDAHVLGAWLRAEQRWGWSEAYRHLRGAVLSPETVLQGLAVSLPVAAAAASPEGGRDLALLPWERSRPAPEGWTALDLPDTGRVVLRAYRPWLRWDEFGVCSVFVDEPGVCRRRPVAFAAPEPGPGASLWWSQRLLHIEQLHAKGRCFSAMHLDVPVRPADGAAARLLVVPAGSPFRIERVEGLTAAGDLPAGRVRLEAAGASAGVVTLSAHAAPGWCFGSFAMPPQVVELDPSEAALAAVVAGAGRPRAPSSGPWLIDRFLPKETPAAAPPPARVATDEPAAHEPAPPLMTPLAPFWYALLAAAAAVLALLLGLGACARHFLRGAEEPGSGSPARGEPGEEAPEAGVARG